MIKPIRNIIFLTVLIIPGIASQVLGQAVSVQASAPAVVRSGEQFRLNYTINANPSSFNGPQLDDFYLLSGPNRSSSSSISIINGRRTQSITITFTYYLQATKEGKFTIAPATATVDRKEYRSNPVSVEVVKGSSASSQQQQQQQQRAPAGTQGGAPAGADDQIFVRILTSTKEVYQGQHIVATLKLYTRLQINGLGKNNIPDFNGFWTQEIPQPSQISLQRENINGVIYNTGIIRKVLLFPQRTGEIEIEPFELEAIVRQKVSGRQGGVFDDFFSSYTNVSRMLVSPGVTIKVLPLPVGKPASFKGAVGKLTMKSDIDKTEAMTNDAITLKFTVSGNGNVKLIDAPDIKFPPDFEFYDPKVSTNIKNTESGQSGSKTYEFLLIPRHAGTFRLPPVQFSYFDLASKSYKSISSPEYTITITKGDDDKQINIVQGLSREEYQRLSTDILFIKTGKYKLLKNGNYLYGSRLFYLLYVICLLAFILIVILRRNRIKRMQNVEMVKNRRANKLAAKRLRIAKDCQSKQQREEFYEAVLKAFMGYLSDKLNIPISNLTKDRAVETLHHYNTDKELVAAFMDVISICEIARYSPMGETEEMNKIYTDSVRILSDLEKNLKR